MAGEHFLGPRYDHLLVTPGADKADKAVEETMFRPVPATAPDTGIRFTYRSEEVEAVQVLTENAEFLKQWCQAVVVEEIDPHDNDNRNIGVNVRGPAGNFRASEGDWVVRRGGRFFTKVPRDHFERLGFEKVDE